MTRYINKKYDFSFTPRSVVTPITDQEPASATPDGTDIQVPPDIIDDARSINEINDKLDNLDAIILGATSDMSVPVDEPHVQQSVRYLSGSADGSIIDQRTWLAALAAKIDADASAIKVPQYDLMESLWSEIKLRICRWLKEIGPINALIGKHLDAAVREAESKSVGAHLSAGVPSVLSGTDVARMLHGDRVLNYLQSRSAEAKMQAHNTAAVDLKPAVDITRKMHNESASIIEGTWGPFSFRKVGYRYDTESPTVSGNGSYIRSRLQSLLSTDAKRAMYESTGYIIDNIGVALDQYLAGGDLSCCLINNLLHLSNLADKNMYRTLKGLRLGLIYSFNGINISISDQLNSVLDIVNRIVSGLLNRIVNTLQSAVDDWLIGLRNRLYDFSRSQPSSWRRCTPFDEMMSLCLSGLYDIEHDLAAYIKDFINTLQFTHKKVAEYSVQVKRRELLRRYIHVLDSIINGVDIGIMCKATDEPGKVTVPTRRELANYISSRRKRDTLTKSELVSYGITPSGDPVDNPNDIDRLIMQDCNKGFTEEELNELMDVLKGIGGGNT